jgi:hypothetical protein
MDKTKSKNRKVNICSLFENVLIILIVITNIIAVIFLTRAFMSAGLDVKTGDRIWVGDASIWIPIVFYFFTSFTSVKKVIYTTIVALLNFVTTWSGYYYLFLVFKFQSNNDFLRSIMLMLYFFIPLIMFIYGLYLLKKLFVKKNNN